MPVRVACACSAVYNLKDQYSGARLGCPLCGRAIDVPRLPPPPPVRRQDGDPAFARETFLLHERHLGVSEKYSVLDKDGAPLLFVERPNHPFLNVLALFGGLAGGLLHFFFFVVAGLAAKRAGLDTVARGLLLLWTFFGSGLAAAAGAQLLFKKRHITVYRDDSRAEVLLRITQDTRLQLLTASYTVAGPGGEPLAVIFKKRLRNILRKRWYGLGPAGPLFVAEEDSPILSLLRRMVLGFLGLMHTDFIIRSPQDGRVLGEFNRGLTLQDRYVLDLTPDSLRALDRRAALALGVLLDTGEGR
jgi:hypothetical protein